MAQPILRTYLFFLCHLSHGLHLSLINLIGIVMNHDLFLGLQAIL
jgi:hypothetical protein